MAALLDPAVRLLEPVLPAGTSASGRLYAAVALLVATTALALVFIRACLGGAGGGRRAGSSKKKKSGVGGGAPHVLMVGTEGAGKTVMCSLMLRGEVPFHDTVTSMEPTRRSGKEGGRSGGLTLTDFPGSSQAKNALLGDELCSASAVIFLIDAARFCKHASEARATASLMKRVLTSPFFVEREPPVLVAFNKVDLLAEGESDAKPGLPLESSPWLRRQRDALQSELNAIKDEMLTSTGEVGDAGSAIQLGSEEDFEFDVDVASEVTFATCTTTKGVSGCKEVLRFAKQHS
jgi:signal recognition particle receptor subunit beta